MGVRVSAKGFRARKQYNPVKGAAIFSPHGAVCILLNESHILRSRVFVVFRRILVPNHLE